MFCYMLSQSFIYFLMMSLHVSMFYKIGKKMRHREGK